MQGLITLDTETDSHLILQHLILRSNGQRQAKKCFSTCAKCRDSDHPAYVQSHPCNCSPFSSIQLFYKQTVKALIRLRGCSSLIWAFTVYTCSRGIFSLVFYLIMGFTQDQAVYTHVTIPSYSYSDNTNYYHLSL